MSPTRKKRTAKSRRRHRAGAIALCALSLLAMATFLARMLTLLADLQLQEALALTPFVFAGALATFVALEWLDWADPDPSINAGSSAGFPNGQEA